MMESTKIEVHSKPILSPTHSLDEGFESDPDRISTDSQQLVAQTPTLQQQQQQQHVEHQQQQHQRAQVTRRVDDSAHSAHCFSHGTGAQGSVSSYSSFSGPTSIICLEGEIDSEIRADIESKLTIPRAVQIRDQQQQQQPHQQRYRRVKTRAPPPPLGTHTFKQRSQSVESAIRSTSLSVSKPNNYDYNGNNMDILTGRSTGGSNGSSNGGSSRSNGGGGGGGSDAAGGDVLAGRFVRVSVDPRNQPHRFGTATVGGSNMYKLYQSSSASSIVHHYPLAAHYGLTLKPGSSSNSGSSSLSSYGSKNYNRYVSAHQQHHVPVSWTQSIPRQTRR